MPSSHLILCRPLLLLPPIPPSIRVFSNESTLRMRWLKYWSFSFSISPSNKHPGLISFRMDWLDLLAVQATLKSLPQHHSSKTSVFQCSAFFTVPLSHTCMHIDMYYIQNVTTSGLLCYYLQPKTTSIPVFPSSSHASLESSLVARIIFKTEASYLCPWLITSSNGSCINQNKILKGDTTLKAYLK